MPKGIGYRDAAKKKMKKVRGGRAKPKGGNPFKGRGVNDADVALNKLVKNKGKGY